jgi:hypothetical protein
MTAERTAQSPVRQSAAERIAEVKLFEASHDFCTAGPELTDEERAANLAWVLKILSGYSAPSMQDYAAVMMAPTATDRVRMRKAARIAACDPASGRISLGQNPEQWMQ